MNGIGTIAVKVSPEAMISQGAEVERLGNDMRLHFQSLRDMMTNTRHYWIGEAGELHRKMYDEQEENIDKMLRRLLEHPGDLERMAGFYRAAERSNVNEAAILDADIIS